MQILRIAALAGIAVGAPLSLAQAQAQAVTMTYDSKQSGTLTLEFHPDHSVTGSYPKYTGHISGTLKGSDRIDGMWWQETAYSDDVKCDTQMNGTSYWGKFTLIENTDQKGFHGMWGSCGKPPDDVWNGTLKP